MINLPNQYSNTPVADGALSLATAQNRNFASAQTRNTPVAAQTPNRISSPEQIAAARQGQQGISNAADTRNIGYLLDVRA
ncbi:MAG TPA: hypothetical protein PLD79_00555 [Halothiobacillus sp.]|nr:hypothetical protein [Halothiobacillus sp.]